MITKQDLLDTIINECKLVKHLFSKLDQKALDYRPNEKMRSTEELLQYLSHVAIGPAKALKNNNWDIARAYTEEAKNLNPEKFISAMDHQIEELKQVFSEFKETDFETSEVKYPWGGKDKLGIGLVNTSLRFITAYRMQLFVYAKTSGLTELNTYNCWMGIDGPKQ